MTGPGQDRTFGCHHSNCKSNFTGVSYSAAPPYLILRQGIKNKDKNKVIFLQVFSSSFIPFIRVQPKISYGIRSIIFPTGKKFNYLYTAICFISYFISCSCLKKKLDFTPMWTQYVLYITYRLHLF